MSILQFKQISKKFGDKNILKNATYEFESGKIYGFIGPNGAGKTTTFKMILGLLEIDSGEILIHDIPVKYGETKTNKHIGYLPDIPDYYHFMNAKEYLTLCAKISLLHFENLDSHIQTLINKVGLKDEDIRISNYSRGMKQRLGIAQALIHNPDILICDEPTSALDPKGRQEILDILASIKHYTTIIFSTHILTDIERICDEVIILSNNKIKNFNSIKSKVENELIHLKLRISTLDREKLKSVHKITEDGQFVFTTIRGTSMEAAYAELKSLEIYPEYIERIDNSLEKLYLEVTK